MPWDRMERVALAALAITLVIKVAVDAGAPEWIFGLSRWLAVLAVILACARRRSLRRWFDGARRIVLLIAIAYLPQVYARVGGDGAEYFVQSRSILFDRDLNFANDYAGLGRDPVISVKGTVVSRPPAGVALLWMPAIALAHVLASVASWFGASLALDGFGVVYTSAATAASYLYGWLAVLLIEAMSRARWGKGIGLLTAIGVALASPLSFYMTANPSMSHAASAFVGSAFVYRWLRVRSSSRSSDWFVLGLLAAVVMMVRIQDVALAVLAGASLIALRNLRCGLGFALALALGALVQAGLWMMQHGPAFIEILTSHSMVAQSSPAFVEFLFSPWHGLVSWTPLYGLALVGLLVLIGREPRLGLSLVACLVAAIAINSTTGDWWASESFGQRRMLGLSAVFGLGIGACLSFVVRRPFLAPATLLAALVAWNLQFAYIYNGELAGPRDGAIAFDRLSRAQVDVVYRRLLRASSWMPSPLWVPLYDALKGVWLFHGTSPFDGRIDLGREPDGFYPLVGDGWFPPESRARRRFRASQTRRSWLSVMLYQRPKEPLRVVLFARRAHPELPLAVRLDVNGSPVGERSVSEDWEEHAFEVDSGLWRRGVNRLTLVYSTTPRLAIQGFRGRNSAVEVDWVEFRSEVGRP